MFQKALEEDPQFDLAEAALLATPTTAMLLMTTSQMVSGAAAAAPPSAAAGTAVVATSVAGTTAAAGTGAAVAAGGFSTTTALVAGVVVVGGGVALAAGGGGGDDEQDPVTRADLTGVWRGSWIESETFSGEATLSLTQTNGSVNGTISIPGDWCLSQGNVTGTVSGDTANLTVQNGSETIAVTVRYNNSPKTLNGTWNYTSSDSGCQGDSGRISSEFLTTGGIEVRW
jgi:hypothetical protein